jgi:hypothetical protein
MKIRTRARLLKEVRPARRKRSGYFAAVRRARELSRFPLRQSTLNGTARGSGVLTVAHQRTSRLPAGPSTAGHSPGERRV